MGTEILTWGRYQLKRAGVSALESGRFCSSPHAPARLVLFQRIDCGPCYLPPAFPVKFSIHYSTDYLQNVKQPPERNKENAWHTFIKRASWELFSSWRGKPVWGQRSEKVFLWPWQNPKVTKYFWSLSQEIPGYLDFPNRSLDISLFDWCLLSPWTLMAF